MAAYDRDYGDVRKFLKQVLRCIPGFKSSPYEVLMLFGMGCPAGEHIVRQHLAKTFELEMLDLNVLQDADAEIAVMDWMVDFEHEEDC